jgi:predicted PurR-regulated permease PerM
MKLFTKQSGITINISAEAVVRTIVIVIVALFLIKFAGKISHQLELIGTAAFLSLALNPAVSRVKRHMHIKSRIWATAVAYVLVIVLLVGFLSLVLPPLIKQTSNFLKDVPITISNLDNQNSHIGKFVAQHNLGTQINKISSSLSSRIGDIPSTLINTATTVGGAVISVITVLVLTFMMLVEGPLWLDRIWATLPADKRKDYKMLSDKMYKIVTGYVNGQVLIAFIAATLSAIVLTIASKVTHTNVNAIALSGIVFLFGLIPLIGNILAAVIVVLICLISSPSLAIIMAIYFPVYLQIENATLQPYIQAKNNQLTPLLVFVAALVGVGFGGLLGAFVAIPAAGCLRVLIEHHFGDRLAPTVSTIAETTEKGV